MPVFGKSLKKFRCHSELPLPAILQKSRTTAFGTMGSELTLNVELFVSSRMLALCCRCGVEGRFGETS
jgi:hypothetical protein